MKKIRLTESEFHSLVKRMVMEVQDQMVEPEMSENIFGDIGRGLKKFRKGYGSKEERDEMKKEFMGDLERMEDKMMDMGFDKTQYGDEENWQGKKEKKAHQHDTEEIAKLVQRREDSQALRDAADIREQIGRAHV